MVRRAGAQDSRVAWTTSHHTALEAITGDPSRNADSGRSEATRPLALSQERSALHQELPPHQGDVGYTCRRPTYGGGVFGGSVRSTRQGAAVTQRGTGSPLRPRDPHSSGRLAPEISWFVSARGHSRASPLRGGALRPHSARAPDALSGTRPSSGGQEGGPGTTAGAIPPWSWPSLAPTRSGR